MSVTVPDLSQDFQPLFPDQTEDVILGRMIGWANEGLDPLIDADLWVDTREGGHFRTCITPMVRELARLYDLAGTEVPMSGFVLWSWGTYLDDLAAVWDVERKQATYATGTETFTGPVGAVITAGTTVAVSPSTPDDPAPQFATTIDGTIPISGFKDIPIQAVEAGSAGNVSAGAITAPSTPLPAGVTITNAEPTSTGTDPETDDSLRARLLQAVAGKGPGAVADYLRWAEAYPGVSRAQVIPIWNGPGTVLVMVSDVNGQPIASAVVNGLEALLDPVAGQGHGVAPVGATVTVETPTLLNLNIAATFVYQTGYTWDGAGGTIAVGPVLQAAISAYLLTIPPGGTVVFSHIYGLIATAAGVQDISAVTVNGGTANIAVPLTPAESPVLASFTAT